VELFWFNSERNRFSPALPRPQESASAYSTGIILTLTLFGDLLRIWEMVDGSWEMVDGSWGDGVMGEWGVFCCQIG
jgi:hypothetical protein